jgi:hypothetical protein
MARRLVAAIIGLGGLLQLALITALLAGYGVTTHTPPHSVLAFAALLALAAVLSALWVFLRMPGGADVSAFALHCISCGHPADGEIAFCTHCGDYSV